ncbi:F-box only protein 15-like [Biomphalaria glabrata]|uniref:F-box only protein 15-like n=1 Tax=Biomphalaria glabrata TaxID=6526 RepID=A0A9W3AXS2_BIOGL|nr:F-box only protein 15-like [Biomphalaria glabrata]
MATVNAHLRHRSTLDAYLRSHSKVINSTNNRKSGTANDNKSHTPSSLPGSKGKKLIKLPTIHSTSERKTKATFDSLPDELIAIILWKLKVGDLVNASQVCKRWHKVANDNSIWKHFYARFVGPTYKEEEDNIPIQDLKDGCWKNLCLKQCRIKRDKIYLKKWRQPDSYTGLKQRPELTLSKVGTRFELSLTNTSNVTWSASHSDIYWHTMSASLRWYDLTFPDLQSLRAVRIYACSPLMFYGPSKPAKDGILQKSLLTEFKGNLKETLQKTKPVGSDTHVELYEIFSGLIIALYKADNEIAFVTFSCHYHNMISRCLSGTPDKCWEMSEVAGIKDDIDPHYGLHGYTCVLLVRNMRQKLLECKFVDLFTTKNKLNGGFALFNPVRKEDKMTHITCLKEINFPWKTNLFKGVVKDVGILDITLLDERGEPFWTVTSCVAVKQSSQTNQFEFDPEAYQSIHYEDTVGKIDLDIGKLDDGRQYLSFVEISISVTAINKLYSTCY